MLLRRVNESKRCSQLPIFQLLSRLKCMGYQLPMLRGPLSSGESYFVQQLWQYEFMVHPLHICWLGSGNADSICRCVDHWSRLSDLQCWYCSYCTEFMCVVAASCMWLFWSKEKWQNNAMLRKYTCMICIWSSLRIFTLLVLRSWTAITPSISFVDALALPLYFMGFLWFPCWSSLFNRA